MLRPMNSKPLVCSELNEIHITFWILRLTCQYPAFVRDLRTTLIKIQAESLHAAYVRGQKGMSSKAPI